YDETQLFKMKSLLRNEDYLNKRYRDELSKDKKDDRRYLIEKRGEPIFIHSGYERDIRIINNMLTDGIIIKENERLIINQSMKKTLEQFLEYLENNNKTIRKSEYFIDNKGIHYS